MAIVRRKIKIVSGKTLKLTKRDTHDIQHRKDNAEYKQICVGTYIGININNYSQHMDG